MNPDFLNQSPREQMMERMGLTSYLMGLENHYGGSKGGGGKGGGSGGRNNPGKNKNAKGKTTTTSTSTGTGSTGTGSTGTGSTGSTGTGSSGSGSGSGNSKGNNNKNKGVKGIGPVSSGDSYSSSLGNNRVSSKTKQGKDKTPAQMSATQRRAQGISLSQVRDAQNKAVKDAAAARNTKFKQTGVQTLGGTKTSFTKAEQAKIKAAGYSVDGYSKAAVRSDADVAAFKAEAEAKAKAAAEAKAKTEADAKLQRMFDPDRLDNQLGITPAQAFSTITTANAVTPAGGISSWYNQGRLPNESKLSIRDLARNDLRQQQQIGKFNPNRKLNLASYARGESNPFRGMPGYGTITGQGEVPGGFQTGPTPSVRQAIERPAKFGFGLLTNPKAAILAAVSAPTPFADGTLDGKPTRFNIDAGGLNIGSGEEGGEEGSRTGRTLGSRLLGGVDAVLGTDLDNLGGRTTPFGNQLTSSINAFNKANQQISNLTGQTEGPINTAKNLAGSLMLGRGVSMEDLARTTEAATRFKEDGVATGLKSLTPQTTQSVGDVYSALEAGRLTQPFTGTDLYKQGLTNFGGENFQGAIRENVNYFTEKYGKLTGDPAQNRKVVTEMLSAKDPRLDSLKALGYQMKENPNINISDQVKNALKPDAKQLKGINKDEMGIIGSLGNFILSNQGRDIVTGNLAGTNNALDLASNIAITGADPTSSTYKASQGFLKTIGAGGQPTAGSIIRGLIPGRMGGSGSGNQSPSALSIGTDGGSSYTPVQQQPIKQPLIPLLPTGQPQSGQDPTALADVAQQSYTSALRSYGIDPNFFARIRPRRFNTRPNSFRRSFIRRYF